MTFTGFLYTATRLFEFIVLIPIVGMLGYFVDAYTSNNQLTPTYILVLFIASVLGSAWCLLTLGHFRREHSVFVSFVDMAFVGTFIAGVYLLRGISNSNCVRFTSESFYYTLGPFGVQQISTDFNKTCSMLKASFAFGIIAIILFFCTSLLALAGGAFYHERNVTVVRSNYHSSRHSARRSRSRRGSSRAPPSRRGSTRSMKHYS